VSIGVNRIRAACFSKALDLGLRPATLIDPSAVISPSAKIGCGTVVMPRVVVNADAVIGRTASSIRAPLWNMTARSGITATFPLGRFWAVGCG